MNALALDIGGANLKWAADDATAGSEPFAVWRQPEALADRLAALCGERAFDVLLVTMTAELCDCFATRRAGVLHVLDAVEALDRPTRNRATRIWSVRDGFVSIAAARDRPMDVAAGNWHALATWAAREHAPGRAVLIDVGSTTSDLVPLADGRCVAQGRTDTQRLATGELVYLGVGRTPLMAVTAQVPLHGRRYGVMAEHFATMDDALALVGGEASDAQATRVLRMIGADLETHSRADAVALAHAFVDAARDRLVDALDRHADVEVALVSGSGEALGEAAARAALPGATIRRLGDIITPARSSAACAHALVELWQTSCRDPMANPVAAKTPR